MKGPPRPIPSDPIPPDPTARYEALRSHAMGPHGPAARDGLAVLLRQGVAAWMEAWSKVAAPPPLSAQNSGPRPPLPDDAGADVVGVLVAMTLGHIEELHA